MWKSFRPELKFSHIHDVCVKKDELIVDLGAVGLLFGEALSYRVSDRFHLDSIIEAQVKNRISIGNDSAFLEWWYNNRTEPFGRRGDFLHTVVFDDWAIVDVITLEEPVLMALSK